MKIARFLRTLSFQIALAMSVLIVAVSALIVWQVDGLIRSNELDRFTDEIEAARLRFGRQIENERQLTLIGASLLANRPDMREAIEQENVFAILRVAGEYYEQASSPLPETTGLHIYDEQGNLIVRTHTTPSTQLSVPAGVLEAIRTGQPVSVMRLDEVRGPSMAGIAPVLDDSGAVVAVIEGLIAIDQPYLEARAQTLRVELGLQANDADLQVTGEHPFTAEEIDDADIERLLDSGTPVMTEGDDAHLTTVYPLMGLDGSPIASVYLGIDEARIIESVSEVREAALRATAIGIALAVVLTGGLVFVALRPIRELVGVAGRIQQNDLETPIPAKGPAEVVDLAHALDDLRLAVWQSREAMLSANLDLASRMDSSTASLTEATQELAVMHGVLAALSSDAPGGLEGVVDHLAELDWVDGALVALAVEDGHLVPAASVGLTPPARTALLGLVNNDAEDQRLESGLIIEDTRGLAGGLRGHELGGLAVQPMLAAGGISGAVAVTTRGPLHITQSRTELLRSVSREIVAMLERTELAGEVEENRRLAEAVLREMTDGVLVIDYTDHCRVANPAAARLLGRNMSQLIGRQPEDILPLSGEGLESLRRRATGRSRVPLTPLLAEVDGRSLAISAGPFVDAEAGPDHLGVLVLIHDLSSEADAERVKQDFVSMVGHELRTPLTLIRTTIDLLNEGDAGQLNETQQRIVRVLHGNSDRLMVLISDLLDMSALDSGRMQIQPTNIDIVDVVEEAVADARPAAAVKDHHLRAELPPSLVAHADRRRVLQVLSNLVGNAIKYTPPGGHIEVSALDREGWVEVRVRDNGIGIPPSEQPQLFQKFYRTMTGRRTTGGTGLGLAIAQSLIDLHGGRVWLESDGESGSTFAFTLPTRPI